MLKAILTDFNYVLWLPGPNGFEINKQLAQFYREHSEAGVEVSILTSGTLAGSDKVQEQIGNFVNKVYYTHQMGKWKSDPTLFTELLEEEIGYEPAEVVLVDDQASNIESAKKAGLHAIQHIDNQKTMEFITNLDNA